MVTEVISLHTSVVSGALFDPENPDNIDHHTPHALHCWYGVQISGQQINIIFTNNQRATSLNRQMGPPPPVISAQ